MDIFFHRGDSEDVKISYAEPKIDPFNAPRFQQVWIFFAMWVMEQKKKYCTPNQKLTLSDAPRL